MIIASSTDDRWEANAYLIADRPGGQGMLVDPNGVVQPLLAIARRKRISIAYVVASHEHEDHVVDLPPLARRVDARVVAHPATADRLGCSALTTEHGAALKVGTLRFDVIATPGHAPGQIALHGHDVCLTADALYSHSVPAQCEPGQEAFDEVRASALALAALPAATRLLPGHGPETAVSDVRDSNPFVRAWLDGPPPAPRPCRVLGDYGWEAALVLQAADYDGGTKAWVRFPRGGDCLLPGGSFLQPSEAQEAEQ